MVSDMGNGEPESDLVESESKKIKVSRFTECALMHSVLHDRTRYVYMCVYERQSLSLLRIPLISRVSVTIWPP